MKSCHWKRNSTGHRIFSNSLPISPISIGTSNTCRIASTTKMAFSDAVQHDPLVLLRQSIASESPCIPTKTEDASSASSVDLSLATANFLQFSAPVQLSIPLTTPTRFISSNKPVDLRSIYFAWLKRETAIPEYNASALALNAELEDGAGGEVQNLAFVERLDLITWLEGASEESEYIKPLASDTSSATASAQVASGAAGGIAPVTSAAGRQGKSIDPRLAEIYNGERRMGDRNSVLRGIKPTVSGRLTHLHDCNSDASRTSHMCASLQLLSMHGNHNMQLHKISQTTRLWPITQRLLREDQIPSFSSRLQHLPYYACLISNPSSKAVFTSLPIHRARDPALLPQFYTWNVYYPQLIPHGLSASSSWTHRSNSSPNIGRVWLQSSLRDKSGNSRATSGSSPLSSSDIPWEYTWDGEGSSLRRL